MSNDKIQAVGVNIAEKATIMWQICSVAPLSPMSTDL